MLPAVLSIGGTTPYIGAARTASLPRKIGRDDPPLPASSARYWIDGVFAMSWIVLFLAGLFEIGWAIGLKYSDGFSKPLPTLLTIASMSVSLGLLGLALKTLPVGTAYAVGT